MSCGLKMEIVNSHLRLNIILIYLKLLTGKVDPKMDRQKLDINCLVNSNSIPGRSDLDPSQVSPNLDLIQLLG